ncbi:hypothetical protein CH063_01154, partial [Colletotrichum higginsianum]
MQCESDVVLRGRRPHPRDPATIASIVASRMRILARVAPPKRRCVAHASLSSLLLIMHATRLALLTGDDESGSDEGPSSLWHFDRGVKCGLYNEYGQNGEEHVATWFRLCCLGRFLPRNNSLITSNCRRNAMLIRAHITMSSASRLHHISASPAALVRPLHICEGQTQVPF